MVAVGGLEVQHIPNPMVIIRHTVGWERVPFLPLPISHLMMQTVITAPAAIFARQTIKNKPSLLYS